MWGRKDVCVRRVYVRRVCRGRVCVCEGVWGEGG